MTFDLYNNKGKHPARFEFYDDGIVNFAVHNPSNKSGFNFYDLEPRPNLSALYPHLRDQTSSSLVLMFSNQAVYDSSSYKSKYKIVMQFEPFKMTLQTETGRILCEFNSNNNLSLIDKVVFDLKFPTQHLFGLSERSGHIYLQETASQESQKEPYKLYARDHPKYKPLSNTGLYGSVPFVANVYDEPSRALTGVLQANSSETYVEIAHNHKNESELTWINECGDLELYFVASDGLRDFFNKSSRVMGFANMPPMWALGFHQCRWGYTNEEMVEDVNSKLKEHGIPCDSITLDIDYTEGFRYFTWNSSTFPDPAKLIRLLREHKRRLICINDPHIKQDDSYTVYKTSKDRGLLVRDARGDNYINLCWPGKSGWMDLANVEAQEYWASLYHYENFPHTTRDVHAWNDMNEPAVFDSVTNNTMPGSNIHTFLKDGEKREVEHRYIHNMYGHLQTKSTFKGMIERDHPDKYRPFILTRSFFAGTQKYSAIWSGDAGSKWQDLRAQVPMALNTSLCGISFCGGDVGGFMGDPSQECAVRWFQSGAFMPFFRAHSDANTKRREPYIYEEQYRNIIVKTIYERYRWLYYWYSVFEEYVRTGYPIMRTVWMETKGKHAATMSMLQEDEQYFIGDAVLIIPISERFRRYVQIHEDMQQEEWFTHDFGFVENPAENYKTGLERIGMFVRGEHIIPLIDVPSYYILS